MTTHTASDTIDPAQLTARMPQPAFVIPGVFESLMQFNQALERVGLPAAVRELVNIRASQINGCGVCNVQHARLAKRRGETDERIWAIAGWRDAPYFSAAERAALALTEAVTRLGDRTDPVPAEVWDEAARYFDEQQLAALLLTISMVNLWNRLNVATRQVAGQEW